MQGKELYEYAIVRLVPKVERGEYINVGVILLSKKCDFLALKYQLDEDRLNAFTAEVDVELVRSYLEGWKLVCKGGDAGGKIGSLEIRVRFRWLTANRSTIIQSSPVHPGFCTNPERQLEQLFEKFVS